MSFDKISSMSAKQFLPTRVKEMAAILLTKLALALVFLRILMLRAMEGMDKKLQRKKEAPSKVLLSLIIPYKADIKIIIQLQSHH